MIRLVREYTGQRGVAGEACLGVLNTRIVVAEWKTRSMVGDGSPVIVRVADRDPDGVTLSATPTVSADAVAAQRDGAGRGDASSAAVMPTV